MEYWETHCKCWRSPNKAIHANLGLGILITQKGSIAFWNIGTKYSTDINSLSRVSYINICSCHGLC